MFKKVVAKKNKPIEGSTEEEGMESPDFEKGEPPEHDTGGMQGNHRKGFQVIIQISHGKKKGK